MAYASTSLRLVYVTDCASWCNWDSWKWGSNSESCRWRDWKSMEAALPQGMLRREAWLLSFCKSSVFPYDPCQYLYNKWTFPHVLQLWYRHNILNLHLQFQRLLYPLHHLCKSFVFPIISITLCFASALSGKVSGWGKYQKCLKLCIFFKSKQKKQKTQG